MSSPFISNLKFEFTESPQKKPSVMISFGGKNFPYENGLSTKLCAQYKKYVAGENKYSLSSLGENSFSEEYLNSYMYDGLKNFYCPGFENVFVSVQRSKLFGGSGLHFEFFASNPLLEQNANCFATSTCQMLSNVTNNKNKYTCVIYNELNDNIGEFTFYYHNANSDELFQLKDDEIKYFCYTLSDAENGWKDATLLYQDRNEENQLNDELYNYYPINENGTIGYSKNYWDFTQDLSLNTSEKYCLRIMLVDSKNNVLTKYQSTIISCNNSRYEKNEIAYFKPVFQYNREKEFNPEYCISETPRYYLITPNENKDYNKVHPFMNKVIYYRFSESISTIDYAAWEQFSSLNGNTEFNFYMTWLGASGTGGEVLDGEKTIILQISDGLGNCSSIVEYDEIPSVDSQIYQDYLWQKDSVRHITLYRQPPNSIVFNVVGSSGSEYYTGMYQDKEGHFIPSNKILVNIYANDNLGLPLEYKLYLGNSYDDADWREFNYPNDESTYYNIPFYLNSESNYGVFDNNYSANVNLIFRNSAGLCSEVKTKNIFYNTKILKTDKTNLREINSSYKPIVEYYNGDEFVRINQLENFDLSVPKRSWNEIFYPETHGLPLDSYGNIDIDEALKINNDNPNYDALKVRLEAGEGENQIKKVVYDKEQRPLTVWNEYLNSKKYRPLQSNSKVYNSDTGEIEGLAYWIIDNTGYNDFKLEFEHFHLDQTQHTQINTLSPFTGDCLVIYDASKEGATSEYIDKYGRKSYRLIDTSKLTMLSAYSGDGINANRIYPDELAGSLSATADGGFTTEKFDTNRICLIFYSDGGGENSGFKIKASPARESDWINWEIDNKRGEIWIHKIDTELLEGSTKNTLTTQAGYCPEKIRMSYEYSETAFDINYEDGSVKFYEKPKGQVLGTFSYYNYDQETGPYKNGEPITTTFALADDDLVDYKDVSIYVSSIKDKKINIDKNSYYSFSIEQENYGKIIKNISLYKDSGLVKFENVLPPKDRMFADYFCHSFYRLTDDGYGNLYFYDDVIIPDKSEYYPDFTYVDLKVINEGEATLKNGKIKFTFRGIASGTTSTTITSVLNPDRPWDVQSGTPEETFDQVGGVVSVDYNFPEMNWNNALAIYEGTVDVGEDIKLTGGKTEINFGVDMDKKKEIYIRVVWTMFKGGNEYSPEYITPTTAGEKCFSGEIEGSFYTVQI